MSFSEPSGSGTTGRRSTANARGDASTGRRRDILARTALALLVALLASLAGATLALATETREMRIDGPDGALAGTLLRAEAEEDGTPAPLVVFAPGSGPTDRDGNSPPAGIFAAPYRLLAEGLADAGISSLRADKRGLFGSAAAVANADAVRVEDYVTDLRAWIDAARAASGAHCVVPLGHSEGGLLALATAAALVDEAREGLCGLVLVAAPGRPVGEVLREQLAANPGMTPALLEQARAAIGTLERGERVDGESISPELAPLFRPPVQDFLIGLLAIDPVAIAAELDLPILVVQGERDLQVSADDARRLADAAGGNGELVLLPDANHVLKAVPADDREANIAAYRDAERPLADGVAEAVAQFVTALDAPAR